MWLVGLFFLVQLCGEAFGSTWQFPEAVTRNLDKMSILGKDSMRDKAKEEGLRKRGEAQYLHLSDDLHVLIEVFAPPAEAYAPMGHALEEIKKFLIPDDNDEIRQAQLQE